MRQVFLTGEEAHHRAALTGIIFVLKSGIPWEMLPQEMGCGSGMTCWRRLRRWHKAGVWQGLLEALLVELQLPARVTNTTFQLPSKAPAERTALASAALGAAAAPARTIRANIRSQAPVRRKRRAEMANDRTDIVVFTRFSKCRLPAIYDSSLQLISRFIVAKA